MVGREPSAGDRWLRVGGVALLALLAGAVVYAVAIGIVNAPRIGV
jgi:Ni/Co efflux regulator RcnB